MTFEELNQRVNESFAAGTYAAAMELLDREGSHFPDQAAIVQYWRMCLAARLNDTALLFRLMDETVSSGRWYAERLWRASPSFAPLQDRPDFERLVKRHVQAQVEGQAGLTTLAPEGAAPPAGWPLLLALHGNMSSPREEVGFWRKAVEEGWFLALPESSQQMWAGGAVWDDRDIAVPEVQGHYVELVEKQPVDPDRAVIGGFSMGGQLALWLALSHSLPVCGFVAVGPYLPDLEGWQTLVRGAQGRGLRGYIITGEKDDTIPHDTLHTLVEWLNAHEIPCRVEEIPGVGHGLGAELRESLERALEFVSIKL